MRDQLTVLNAFVHDVATGTWISSLLLSAMLRSELEGKLWARALDVAGPLQRKFMWVTWAALGIVLATGVVRMLTLRAFGWTGDVARDRIRVLKIKHAILGIVFAAGTAWQAALVYAS